MIRINKGIVLVILFLIFFQFKLLGQESIQFQAYGHTPEFVDASLYKALYNTSEINEKLELLYSIGNEYKKIGDADSIIHYANLIKSLTIVKNSAISNTRLHQSRAQLLLGNGKYLNGLFDEALKAYVEGIDVSKSLTNSTENNLIKLGLGEVYFQQKEYKKAATLFSQLLKIKSETNILAKTNFYLGFIAFKKNDFALAKEYYTTAKNKLPKGKSSKLELWIQLNLGRLAAIENKNDKAFSIYESIRNNALNKNYLDIYTEAVLEYGEVCVKLEQYQMAEIALSTAYTNAIQWNRLELQKKIINSLRLLYQAKGDYENAYNLMTQYNAVSNQITRQQNSKAIKEIEIKYQTLQKENQIYELKEEQQAKQIEIERQKTTKKAFLYGFLALLIPIIALLLVYYQKLQTQSQLNRQQEELNSQRIAVLLNTQELEIARTSLDAQQEERHRIAKQLHDSIGGNLAGIKLQLANIEGNTKFQKNVINQVNDTYELVRDISHDLVPKKFNQNAFTFLIENYIEQLQENSKLEIAFSAHPKAEINNLSEKLKVELYQITQELFTNTIKHANANNIEIHLNLHETTFQLIFEDDGNGFEIENLRKGIGLKNIENRLHKLHGELILDSAPKRGTVITIEIPLKD
jgi:signal transduction histidine kinase